MKYSQSQLFKSELRGISDVLELIHSLLGSVYQESPVKSMKATELIEHFYHRDVTVCEKCHGSLEIYPRMSRISAAIMIRAA